MTYRRLPHCARASSADASAPAPSKPQPTINPSIMIGGALAVAAACSLYGATGGSSLPFSWGTLMSLKAGFISAFSIIFISELGDKTFFIAALLAMKRGKFLVFTGAVAALAIMTVISVALGVVFQKVPTVLSSQSLPIGQYLGAALLVYFGIRNIMDALEANPANEADSAGDEATGELADAEEFVESAESTKASTTTWGALVESFSLIFVAEWGDRSMLATIALGAAQNPVAVALGAIAGHAAATVIAVLGGAFLSKYISERVVGLTGGVLFLVFAVATVLGVF